MSFDLFLAAFRDGRNAMGDVAAARIVLERNRFTHRAEFNEYDICFDDGSHVVMYAGGLDGGEKPFNGAMFALRGFSEAIVTFVFEFSRAAECVILPTMEPASVLLPRDDLEAHLPTDLVKEFQPIAITSDTELLAFLTGGYDSWRAYRKHAFQKSGSRPAGGT
jgi:hypothetical protein